MTEHGTGPAEDRTIMWVVVLVIGTLVGWAAGSSLVGSQPAFALSVVAGVVAASIGWRHHITFDLVSNVALVVLPAAVVGLSLT
ncbi:hypothetical protein [Nocardioides sp.]|uniref:hypothetical protein n=1 Tax=Nocardioides sp. TaxID=35761 RepID=UPI00378353A1